MAAAIAYQQTAVAETSAFFFAMLLAPNLLRRDAFVFLATVAAITVAWLTAAVITAGAGTVAFALAGFYVSYTQKALPASAAGGVAHFGLAAGAALLIAAGAIASRLRPRADWVLALWAGATILVTAVAGQPFPHFLAPAVAPLTLLIAGSAGAVDELVRHAAGARSSVLACRPPGLVVAILMAKVAGHRLGAAARRRRPTRTRSAATTAARPSPPSTRPGGRNGSTTSTTGSPATPAAAAWITAHGFSGEPAVVWSYDAWIYALANLQIIMPTPPIYNDEVLLGYGGPVEQYVAKQRPVLIVVDSGAQVLFPEIGTLLDSGEYVDEYHSGPDSVWVRADTAASACP